MATRALRHGRPIWLRLDRRRRVRRFPPLNGHRDVEVAIVGGGMTGAMIAAHFASSGVRVAVLEANRGGSGSTAASTALLLQEPDLDLSSLAKRYGQSASRRIWELSFAAARHLASSFVKEKIACDLLYRDSVYYTKSAERARLLQRELAARHDAGLPGEWLSPRRVRDLTGITARRRDPHAWQRAIESAIVPALACSMPPIATARRSSNDRACGAFNSGRAACDCIPGAARIDARPGGDRHRLCDARLPSAGRTLPDAPHLRARHPSAVAPRSSRGRVGAGDVVGHRTAVSLRAVDAGSPAAARRRRPSINGRAASGRCSAKARETCATTLKRICRRSHTSAIDYAWEGRFAMTPDGLPYIGPHRRYPRHAFALGYGGNGMTFAWMAAQILLEQWKGIASSDHQLFDFSRAR